MRRIILSLSLTLVAFALPAAEGIRAVFADLAKEATTPEQRVATAEDFLIKTADFPGERVWLCEQAQALCEAAQTAATLPILRRSFELRLEHTAEADKESIYAGWVEAGAGWHRWRLKPEEQQVLSADLLAAHAARAALHLQARRFLTAKEALDAQQDYVRRYYRYIPDSRDRGTELRKQIAAIRSLADEEAKMAKVAERAKDPEDAAANAEYGAWLFDRDEVAKAIPHLERGGEAAKDRLAIARTARLLIDPTTPNGLRQSDLAVLRAAHAAGKDLKEPLEILKQEPDLFEPIMRVKLAEVEQTPVAEPLAKLLEAAEKLLAEKAAPPTAAELVTAADGYDALAKADRNYGDKRMAETAKFHLSKAVQYYDLAAQADAEGREGKVAKLKGEFAAKKLEAAGGYESPLAALALPGLGGAPPRPAWATKTGKDKYGHWAEFTVGKLTIKMRWIGPGKFLMGDDEKAHAWVLEQKDFDKEVAGRSLPQHAVTLTEGFWLCEHECTQALWQAVMGANPAKFKADPQNPVEQVSWDQCQQFLARLGTQVKGLEPRLPTEAQWEYACRAGTTTHYNWGDDPGQGLGNWGNSDGDARQWYGSNEQVALFKQKNLPTNATMPVGTFKPNAWGLYDMHGNVFEWCQDFFGPYVDDAQTDPTGPASGRERVRRGGCWLIVPRACRSAYRHRVAPGVRGHYLGLRLSAPGRLGRDK